MTSKKAAIKNNPVAIQIKDRIQHHLTYTLGDISDQGKSNTKHAWWEAVSMAVNDVIFPMLTQTQARHREQDVRARALLRRAGLDAEPRQQQDQGQGASHGGRIASAPATEKRRPAN